MKIPYFFCVTWVLLLGFNISSDAFIVHYFESHHNASQSLGDGSTGRMICHCNGQKTTEIFSEANFDAVLKSMQEHNFCGNDNQTRVCKLLTECNDCTAEVEHCKQSPKGVFDCHKKSVEMRDKYFINANTYIGSRTLSRKPRDIFSCVYPRDLKTADLYIVMYPKELVVTERCIFGHTLREGITRDLKCRFDKNKWEPTKFEECQPFVDCTVHLQSPGEVFCTQGTIRHGPRCNVSCDHYEDMPAVAEEMYECTIDGGWRPRLPYCASSGSGLHLVPAPRVKFHPTKA